MHRTESARARSSPRGARRHWSTSAQPGRPVRRAVTRLTAPAAPATLAVSSGTVAAATRKFARQRGSLYHGFRQGVHFYGSGSQAKAQEELPVLHGQVQGAGLQERGNSARISGRAGPHSQGPPDRHMPKAPEQVDQGHQAGTRNGPAAVRDSLEASAPPKLARPAPSAGLCFGQPRAGNLARRPPRRGFRPQMAPGPGNRKLLRRLVRRHRQKPPARPNPPAQAMAGCNGTLVSAPDPMKWRGPRECSQDTPARPPIHALCAAGLEARLPSIGAVQAGARCGRTAAQPALQRQFPAKHQNAPHATGAQSCPALPAPAPSRARHRPA